MRTALTIRQLFFIGLVGGLLSATGDALLSFHTYPAANTVYEALLAGCKDISYTRLALSALFGSIGIPLQAFGLEAFARLMYDETRFCKGVRFGALATALFGGTVHVLCVVLMLLVKNECLGGFDPLTAASVTAMFPPSSVPFILWAILPLSMLCMVPYFAATVLIFIALLRKKTPLPAWCCVCSPVVFVGVLQLIAIVFVPNNPLFNAMNMANKALGAIALFLCGFLRSRRLNR